MAKQHTLTILFVSLTAPIFGTAAADAQHISREQFLPTHISRQQFLPTHISPQQVVSPTISRQQFMPTHISPRQVISPTISRQQFITPGYRRR